MRENEEESAANGGDEGGGEKPGEVCSVGLERGAPLPLHRGTCMCLYTYVLPRMVT